MQEEDFDRLRQSWSKIKIQAPDTKIGTGGSGGSDPDSRDGKSTLGRRFPTSAHSKMVRQTYVMVGFCIIGIVAGAEMCRDLGLPEWFMLCMIGYFVIAAAFTLGQFVLLKSIDPAKITACQALRSVTRLRRLRLTSRIVLITLCVPLVIALASLISEREQIYIIAPMAVGLISGLTIGLRLYFKFKEHMQSFDEFGEDPEPSDNQSTH